MKHIKDPGSLRDAGENSRERESGTPEAKKNEKETPSSGALPTGNEQRTEELKRLQGEKKSRRRKETLGGTISGIVKTAGYLTLVSILGVALAIFVIFVANDVFAMNDNLKAKRFEDGELPEDPTMVVEVTLEEYADINDVADLLYRNGLIKFPKIFRLYAALRHKSDRNFTAGEYTLDSTMGYDALLSVFVPSRGKREQIAVTHPGGATAWTISSICWWKRASAARRALPRRSTAKATIIGFWKICRP